MNSAIHEDTRTRHDVPTTHPGQGTLLELSGEKLSPYWIDLNQELFIPDNPLHYEAHRLQLLLARMEKVFEFKPTHFSSPGYVQILEKYTQLCKEIKKGVTDGADDEGKVGDTWDEESEAEMGQGERSSVGSGISADNPFTG